MEWTPDDVAAAAADGWGLGRDSFAPYSIDRKKFPTNKALRNHLYNLRHGERVQPVPGTQGGLRRTYTEGIACKALKLYDRALVQSGAKQFLDVDGTFGAPMARPEYGDPGDKAMYLFKVTMVDGDYDDGGAYWGGDRGTEPLFCMRNQRLDGEVQRFVRAQTRVHAYFKFRVDYETFTLFQPINAQIIIAFQEEIIRGEREPDGTRVKRL